MHRYSDVTHVGLDTMRGMNRRLKIDSARVSIRLPSRVINFFRRITDNPSASAAESGWCFQLEIWLSRIRLSRSRLFNCTVLSLIHKHWVCCAFDEHMIHPMKQLMIVRSNHFGCGKLRTQCLFYSQKQHFIHRIEMNRRSLAVLPVQISQMQILPFSSFIRLMILYVAKTRLNK